MEMEMERQNVQASASAVDKLIIDSDELMIEDSQPADFPELCSKLIRLSSWPPNVSLCLDSTTNPRFFHPAGNTNKNNKVIHLSKNGIPRYLYPIPPDGDCFYHAVLTALAPEEKINLLNACGLLTKDNSSEVQTIRNALAKYITEHPDEIKEFIPSNSMNDLVNEILRLGSWAGQHGDIVPYLITRLPGWPKDRSISIYQEGSTNPLENIVPEGSSDKECKRIRLLLNNSHYEVILDPMVSHERTMIDSLPANSSYEKNVYCTQEGDFYSIILNALDFEERARLLGFPALQLRPTKDDEIKLRLLLQGEETVIKENEKVIDAVPFSLSKLTVAIWKSLHDVGVNLLKQKAISYGMTLLNIGSPAQAIITILKISGSLRNKEVFSGLMQVINALFIFGVFEREEGDVIDLLSLNLMNFMGGDLYKILFVDSTKDFIGFLGVSPLLLISLLLVESYFFHVNEIVDTNSQEYRLVSYLMGRINSALSLLQDVSNILKPTVNYYNEMIMKIEQQKHRKNMVAMAKKNVADYKNKINSGHHSTAYKRNNVEIDYAKSDEIVVVESQSLLGVTTASALISQHKSMKYIGGIALLLPAIYYSTNALYEYFKYGNDNKADMSENDYKIYDDISSDDYDRFTGEIIFNALMSDDVELRQSIIRDLISEYYSYESENKLNPQARYKRSADRYNDTDLEFNSFLNSLMDRYKIEKFSEQQISRIKDGFYTTHFKPKYEVVNSNVHLPFSEKFIYSFNKTSLSFNYVNMSEVFLNQNGTKNIIYTKNNLYGKMISLKLINKGFFSKNRKYHDFITDLFNLGLGLTGVKTIFEGGDGYILPQMAVLFYEAILEKIVFWNGNVFRHKYYNDDIYFILTLRNDLRNVYNYLHGLNINEVSSFLKAHPHFYHMGANTNKGLSSDFMRYISSRYLGDNAFITQKSNLPIMNVLDNNLAKMNNMYNILKNYIYDLSMLPVPIEVGSLLSDTITNIVGAINNSTQFFGNFYSLNKNGAINDTLYKDFEIKAWFFDDIVNSFGLGNKYADTVNVFINHLNSEYGTEFYKKARSNLEYSFNKQFDIISKELYKGNDVNEESSNDSPVGLFVDSIQEIISRYSADYNSLPKEKKEVIAYFATQGLKKEHISNMTTRGYITDFLIDKIYFPMFKENLGVDRFSIYSLSEIFGFDLRQLHESSFSSLQDSDEDKEISQTVLNIYIEYTIPILNMLMILFQNDTDISFDKFFMVNETETGSEGEIETEIDIANDLFSPDQSRIIRKLFRPVDSFTIPYSSYKPDNKTVIPFLLNDLDDIISMRFLSTMVEKNETIKSYILKNMVHFESVFIQKGEEALKNITILASKNLPYDNDLESYKKSNIFLLRVYQQSDDRLMLIELVTDIVSRCHQVDGIYSSPYIVKDDALLLESIKLSIVAAVRHIYDDATISVAQAMNLYHTVVIEKLEEEYHLRALAALYWAMFYKSDTSQYVQSILPLFDAKNKTQGFAEQYNESSIKIKKTFKLLVSHATIERLVRIFDFYLNEYEGIEEMRERELSGDNMPAYFSIMDIKRRSAMPGNSQSKFAEQFTNARANIEKDIMRIKGHTLRKSGIDVNTLKSKPKAIYKYKHINTDYEEMVHSHDFSSSIEGRDDDLLVIILPDNGYLFSFASLRHNEVIYIPGDEIANNSVPLLKGTGVVIDNVLPFLFIGNGGDKQELSGFNYDVYLRYNIKDFHYDVSEPEPEYIFIDAGKLSRRLNYGIIDEYRTPMALFQNRGRGGNMSIENIIDVQLKNYLEETMLILENDYNDSEDTIGTVLGFIPFMSALRKRYDGLPLNRQDIASIILDFVMLVVGMDGKVVTSIAEQDFKSIISKSITTELEQDAGKVTFATFSRISLNAIKALSHLSSSAVRIMLKEFLKNTPLPIFRTGAELIHSGLKGSLRYASPRALREWIKISKNPKQYRNIAEMTTQGRYALRTQELMENISGKKIPLADIPSKNGLKLHYIPKDVEHITAVNSKQKLRPAALNMYEQDVDFNEVLNDDSFNRLLDECQYEISVNNYKSVYRTKIDGSNVKLQMSGVDRETALYRARYIDGHTLYRSDAMGMKQIQRELSSSEYKQAQYAMNSIDSAKILSAKIANILGRAVLFGDEAVLNELRSIVRQYLDHEVSDAVIDDIIRTTHDRNALLLQMLGNFNDQIERGVRNIEAPELFFFNKEDGPVAFVYPNDYSHSVFYNINPHYANPHKSIMHELSHHAGTTDILYMSVSPGPYTPIGERIRMLTRFDNLEAFTMGVPQSDIRTMLNIPPDVALEQASYAAAFEISKEPRFSVDFIKNNADCFVEFIDRLDQHFEIDKYNRLSLAGPSRHRRDIPSNNGAHGMLKLLFPIFATLK